MNLNYVIINIGTIVNDNESDDVNRAFDATVSNFTELYGNVKGDNKVLSTGVLYDTFRAASLSGLELVQLPMIDLAMFANSGVTAATYGGEEVIGQITITDSGVISLAADVSVNIGLDDFTDCSIASPNSGETLVYTGSVFENRATNEELISSTIISSSTPSIVITGDWSEYKHIEVRVYNLFPETTDTALRLTSSTDLGSTWEGDANWRSNYMTLTIDNTFDTLLDSTYAPMNYYTGTYGVNTSIGYVHCSIILRNIGKAKYTHMEARGCYYSTAGSHMSVWANARHEVAEVINGIKLEMSSGNIESVKVEIRGIR